ncbi:MAG: hypothetical protein Q8P56_00995, partial [Candidatus Uhrbacteria bacterium]|nr:hypothetical protein [Candidatus Uhrbacteria bacterium]
QPNYYVITADTKNPLKNHLSAPTKIVTTKHNALNAENNNNPMKIQLKNTPNTNDTENPIRQKAIQIIEKIIVKQGIISSLKGELYYKIEDAIVKILTSDWKCPFYENCPECNGPLTQTFSAENGDDENIWWCKDCDVAIDSDGGYTK